ncbi:putative protein-serine/threonine phosphatase [Helianthus annuus]|nr:putative protein-serine/threonine phosphatase [Helianthus annuus]
MSVELASDTHGNLDEQISQLMQCKPLIEPEGFCYLTIVYDWNGMEWNYVFIYFILVTVVIDGSEFVNRLYIFDLNSWLKSFCFFNL